MRVDSKTVRPRTSPLSRESILDAATALLDEGRQEFSLRELGEALGVHNTAFYRHFRNKNQLLLAAADLVLVDVTAGADKTADPFDGVSLVCRAVRKALLARHVDASPSRRIGQHPRHVMVAGCEQGGRDPEVTGRTGAGVERAAGRHPDSLARQGDEC